MDSHHDNSSFASHDHSSFASHTPDHHHHHHTPDHHHHHTPDHHHHNPGHHHHHHKHHHHHQDDGSSSIVFQQPSYGSFPTSTTTTSKPPLAPKRDVINKERTPLLPTTRKEGAAKAKAKAIEDPIEKTTDHHQYYVSSSMKYFICFSLLCLLLLIFLYYFLKCMKPEDVGLTQDMPSFRIIEHKRSPLVTYLHLYECDKFSIGIFCLPPSAVIPLHNHPEMTVFSKLLFESMRIKSYDWIADVPRITSENLNPVHCQPSGLRLTKVNIDSVFTAPCNTSILYPAAGGNMHRFTALTSCAVLDVLGPSYCDSEGQGRNLYILPRFPIC